MKLFIAYNIHKISRSPFRDLIESLSMSNLPPTTQDLVAVPSVLDCHDEIERTFNNLKLNVGHCN